MYQTLKVDHICSYEVCKQSFFSYSTKLALVTSKHAPSTMPED